MKKIVVPEILIEPHKLTQKTHVALEKGKTGDRGLIMPRNKIHLDVKVTRDSIARACLIMDALLKAIEGEGYAVSVSREAPTKTKVVVDGESIEIGLDERISQIDHIFTEEEKREKNAGDGLMRLNSISFPLEN